MKYVVRQKDFDKLLNKLTKLELIKLVMEDKASKRIENELFLMDFICDENEDDIKVIEIDEVY